MKIQNETWPEEFKVQFRFGLNNVTFYDGYVAIIEGDDYCFTFENIDALKNFAISDGEAWHSLYDIYEIYEARLSPQEECIFEAARQYEAMR